MSKQFDAFIIGGGPAGSAAAIVLARAGWSVAVAERAPFPRRKVCGEFLSATNLPLLRDLGVDTAFTNSAGPEIRRVAVFARDHAVIAPMPELSAGPDFEYGRALGREHLDTLLLARARDAGATVLQPYNVARRTDIPARVVIAAHGSWDAGSLDTQPPKRRAHPSDLFGFKAHFLGARLQRDLMPLLAFPGGYGGMVHTDHDRVSLSCCIRRDALERCRRDYARDAAGESVLAHIRRSCRAVDEALAPATIEQGWRAAGPIRTGIRRTSCDGAFLVGNAAGEAHPVVAEGISMALQSGWTLAHLLGSEQNVDRVRTEYAAAWRRLFAPRIRAAAVIAHWAMRPGAVAAVLPLLRAFPLVITHGARNAGKVTPIWSPSF